jgi:nucleoid-associated protein YgaU
MNDLRPGTELLLPHLEGITKTTQTGAADPAVPRRRKPPARARDRHEGDPGRAIEIKYYNVQEGDRYATIAEKFLGDKARWPEIHELNKDIFPDPGRIQHGVRIRIPVQGPAGRHQATP